MFWKRKGKKKDGEAGGGSAAVALDETRDGAEDTPEGAGGSDAETGGATDGTAEEAGGSTAQKAPAKGGKAAEAGESEDAEDSGSDGTEDAADDDAADARDGSDGSDDAAGPAGAKDGATAAAGRGGDAADASGSEASEDAEDAEDSEDAEGSEDSEDEDAAPQRVIRPIEPEEPGIGEADSDGIQRVRTEGLLNVDDEEFSVVSNTWIVKADDEGVIVVDPAHDAEMILEAVGDREIYLVACTNAYNTHIAAALEVAERDEAPIALHRREVRAWRRVHGAEHRPEIELEGGGSLAAGDLEIDVLPLPGTSPGTVGFSIPELGAVFSGDTLRAGELGTVGEGYIDYTRQLHSVGEVLLSLPPDTRVLPDQGPETTVEEESANFSSWV
ncbi:MBL fold metallo-hydrolase [Nocardiopsis coralliicola]